MSATAGVCGVTNEADQPLREERLTTQLPRPCASVSTSRLRERLPPAARASEGALRSAGVMSATARICVVTNEADQPLREERRTTQLPRPCASASPNLNG